MRLDRSRLHRLERQGRHDAAAAVQLRHPGIDFEGERGLRKTEQT